MSPFTLLITAAILQAGSFALDKAILNLRKVDYRRYTLLSFPLIAILTGIGWCIIRPGTPLAALTTGIMPWILLGTALAQIISNILFYRALQNDTLNEIQLWSMFQRVPIIIVAGFLFADERNWFVLTLAIIAALAVVWSHTNHHRLVIRKRTAPYILWILLWAPIGAALSKIILRSLDPVTMELARSIPIALVFLLLYHSAARPIGARSWIYLLVTNLLTTTAWLLYYYGYQQLGIVRTILVFSIQPLLVYLGSLVLFRERFIVKRFIGFVVVLGSIIAAHLLG